MLRVRKRGDFVNQAIKHQLGWCSCIFNTAGISNSLMEHKLDTNTWERQIQRPRKWPQSRQLSELCFEEVWRENIKKNFLFAPFETSKNNFVGKIQYLYCL